MAKIKRLFQFFLAVDLRNKYTDAILIDFVKLMNKKYQDFCFVFHSTQSLRTKVEDFVKQSELKNADVISDEKIKNHILKNLFLR